MALYGVAYAAGSLSCSLPLFLAAVGWRPSPAMASADGLASYLAYALGMGLFVTAAAVVAATAGCGRAAARPLRITVAPDGVRGRIDGCRVLSCLLLGQ